MRVEHFSAMHAHVTSALACAERCTVRGFVRSALRATTNVVSVQRLRPSAPFAASVRARVDRLAKHLDPRSVTPCAGADLRERSAAREVGGALQREAFAFATRCRTNIIRLQLSCSLPMRSALHRASHVFRREKFVDGSPSRRTRIRAQTAHVPVRLSRSITSIHQGVRESAAP